MRIDLIGVVEDGSNRSDALPLNMRRSLQVPIGGDFVLHVAVLRPDNSAYDLTGSTVTFTVKRSALQWNVPPGFKKTGTLDPLNRSTVLFTVTPADTRLELPGRFVYDVWVTDVAGKRQQIIPLSEFILTPAATLP